MLDAFLSSFLPLFSLILTASVEAVEAVLGCLAYLELVFVEVELEDLFEAFLEADGFDGPMNCGVIFEGFTS